MNKSKGSCDSSYRPDFVPEVMEEMAFTTGPYPAQLNNDIQNANGSIQMNFRPERQGRRMTLRKAGLPSDLAMEGKMAYRLNFIDYPAGSGPWDGDCECGDWDSEVNGRSYNNAGYGLTAAERYAMEVWEAVEVATKNGDMDNIPDLFDLDSSMRTKLDTRRDATPAGKEWKSKECNVSCEFKPFPTDHNGVSPHITAVFQKH